MPLFNKRGELVEWLHSALPGVTSRIEAVCGAIGLWAGELVEWALAKGIAISYRMVELYGWNGRGAENWSNG